MAQNKDFITKLEGWFGQANVQNSEQVMSACDYLKWADLHDIALTFNYLSSDIDQCNAIINSYYSFVLDTDERLGYLGANQFMKQTLDQISHIAG